ncbi:MAG: hypothetical protein AAFP20_10610 [Cyanobacteria bacterium J06614_10]
MAYGNFTFEQLIDTFDLSLQESSGLFESVPGIESSELLKATLAETLDLAVALSTEKARSELIIMPVMLELRRRFNRKISLFSGIDFSVSLEQGLNGVCDFLVSRSAEQLFVRSPVIMLVEAKNENLKAGLPQCIAEMVAAQQFNQAKGNPVDTVYGVVTIGTTWRFLRLKGRTVEIDLSEYYIEELEKILGILCSAITSQPD